MGWSIYKPGQGYWTRLISGLAGGVLVIAGAGWLWREIEGYNLDNGVYYQAGVAVLVIGFFGLMLYRWTSVKPGTVDFLIATEGEMKKVNWPSKREVVGSTWIVIACLIFFVAVLFSSDLLFQFIFRKIGVLEV